MNFEPTEDQSALTSSLERLLTERYSFEKRRALVAAGAAHDPRAWAGLAELGLTALTLPEAHGGFGGGARDLLPVMQALGRSLCLEPYLPSVVAAAAVQLAADEETRARLLPGVASGAVRLVWAHDETAGRHAARWIETRAECKNGRWLLNGAKSPVPGAGLAQQFVVSARVGGAPADDEGRALFLVDAGDAAAGLRTFHLVDDTAAGELQLRDTPAEALGDPFDAARGGAAIAAAVNTGIAAACADMAGAAQAAFDLAMDYLRTRKQFGRLIGENQALRHRAAEMLVALEMARSMAAAAAVAADAPGAEESAADIHRAKLSVARNARTVAHGAIQLHGGIGMTEEYAVGHYLRRIHVLDQLFGDGDAHAVRLAAVLG
jgi:pimeloyl-CoA dehydrogenase